ncbi:heavy metal translocating P-type ATPase [Paracoccus aestuariivivens]|uniref:P-type Cu(+) transporter n=1 Tax=Paracoccus aestuariivivens TaxID=1820333 RepID=A0A6L6J306_9RHOB|nr:heavy metal translocating P-type ATPase [Paracoccus aestuariivivens]MTH76513.1 heavy metal translocating P-type ATPase [Paracoccus aestuariivivens]
MTKHSNIPNGDAQLAITGMSCASCVGRVEKALKAVPGISAPSVNLATGQAHFHLTSPDGMADAVAALEKAGYPAALLETRLAIEGMSCASCVGRVEKALSALPGVTSATVNLATGAAAISHSPATAPQALADTVTAKGYPAKVIVPDQHHHMHDHGGDAATLRHNFLLALALTIPVFLVEMGGHAFPALHHWLYATIGRTPLWFFGFLLTTAVLAGPGKVFFRVGIPALLRGAPEMNSLVALGAGAAWLYSTVATFLPHVLPQSALHVYFEAAAVIVTLILMGRWLEARAKGQAGAAIRRLVELTPDTALVERGGQAVELPVAQLAAGDIVHLRPGERVAVDGLLTVGSGAIDESMLTGEPVPVTKSAGDPVTGGTVNGMSALTYRVTATGADTVLARIIRLVQDAQASKLPVQAAVDRITAIFVPVVIGLALLAFAGWLLATGSLGQALVAAISVLIIACPCAMGLAVPVSIMVGTGRGAELGILFRRGDALQHLADAEIVGFDKTGTLTLGRPTLRELMTNGLSKDEALRLAASAEARSEHPLAAAIVAAAKERGLGLADAQSVTASVGRGLTARVDGHDLLIGNADAMTEAGITPDATLIDRARDWASEGATPVHLACDGRHIAAMALADPLRPEAAQAIAELDAMGLQTVMISGDVQATADAVGRKLGIDRVIAGVLPEGKLQVIRDMGKNTVFVGDGINDAPALAAARTGIAIGTGTDVAIESAEVVLSGGDPQGVSRAIRLSRAVMRNIRQNLFWAFAYNAALIPVAMGILVPFGGPQLSPMLGAGAMALSSVFVVTNALRLRRFA